MSKPIDDGGPAFPRGIAANDVGVHQGWDGMSRRDWLAGMAMPSALHEWSIASSMTLKQHGYESWEAAAAAMAYRAADAMIAEGRKERGDG